MARLWHSGAELGHIHAENLAIAGATITFDTVTKRSGNRSFKIESSTAGLLQFAFTGATARTYYACAHFLFPAATGMPSGATTRVLGFHTAGSVVIGSVAVTTAGKVQLLDSANAQVGSDSAATLTTDTWYRIELVLRVNASTNDDTLEAYLDGVQVAATTTANLGTTAPGLLNFGWVTDPGTSEVVYVDDIALNDSTGSVNTGLVGNQKVYALFPTSDNARTNWTNGAAGTTNLFDAVDNIPPTGVSTATSGATNQVENPTSGAGAAYDANMTTYTAAGIGAGDTVTAIMTVVEVGSSSTTGSDTITHSVVSNPAIAGVAQSCDIVAGTYPTSWNRGQGTMSENPTVTVGTAPVMRIAKDVATTRINSCCLMAMYVSVTPQTGDYAVPLATASAAGLAVTLLLQSPLGLASGAGLAATIGLAAPTATGSAAGLAPTPQANAAPPLATAFGAGLAPSFGLAAPLGAASGAGSVPTLALLLALATASAQGYDATMVAGSAGETFVVDLATAIAAGLLPEIRVAADVPTGATLGAAFAPSIGLSLPAGDASGAGLAASLGLTVPLGAASGAGIAPTPATSVVVPLATALGSGLLPLLGLAAPLGAASGAGIVFAQLSLGVPPATASAAGAVPSFVLSVPIGSASGAGIAPDRLVLLVPLATATALAYVPTIPGLSEATFDVDRATATAAGLDPLVTIGVDVPSAAALAAGIAPGIVTTIDVPVASAIAAAEVPLLVLLVPTATATGVGLVPVIVGLTPAVFGPLAAHLRAVHVLRATLAGEHTLSARVLRGHTLDAAIAAE